MVVVCEGASGEDESYKDVDVISQVDELILAGKVKNDAIKMVAKRMGIPKQELYKAYIESKQND